jgi:TRAP-type transport system small permease protein
MSRLYRSFVVLRDALDGLSRLAVIGLVGIMTSAIVAQVGLRYFFGSSIGWADETARLCFVGAIFLAVPHGVKGNLHVGIQFLRHDQGTVLSSALSAVTRVAIAAFLIVVGTQATLLTVRNWGNELPTVPLPYGLFFLALAICCWHSLMHLVGPTPLTPSERKVETVV